MKRISFKLIETLMIFLSAVLLCCILSVQADAASGSIAWQSSNIQPTAYSNISVGFLKYSSITRTQEGYMRVYCDDYSMLHIEYYDEDFNILRKGSMPIELDHWGGFFAGANGNYYIITGKDNLEENDSAEVIRVTKYDSDWNRISAASIAVEDAFYDDGIRFPFHSANVNAVEYNGKLYIVTGHQGYVDDRYGQGHQGFTMIEVDESSMTGRIIDYDFGHSFAQFIDVNDGQLYILEQSEGTRSTKLSRFSFDRMHRSDFIPVLEYGGTRTSAWSITCYATVDGMGISSDNILSIGTSIDQSQYENYNINVPYNIYLTVTPVNDFTQEATTVKWLTSYQGYGAQFWGLNLTKINDDRFLVTWREMPREGETADLQDYNDTLSASELHYMLIDGNGDVISKEYMVAAGFSDCKPILVGKNIVFCSSDGLVIDFYTINTDNGEFTKRVHRPAGDTAVWNFTNGVLTLSGTGVIKFTTNINDATSYLSDKVKSIVIKKGIKSISYRALAGFHANETVVIEDGLEEIGKEAFYGCLDLKTITIPDSVVRMGEDCLWTGEAWGIREQAKIITTSCMSEAAKYARKNKIEYEATTHIWGPWAPDPDPEWANWDYRICSICGDYDYRCIRKTKKSSKKKNKSSAKEQSEIVDLPVVKIVKPKAAKKAVTVKWKKISKKNKKKIQGVEIQYSLDGFKTITGTKHGKKSKTSLKIKKLESKKKYWIRIRAYKNAKDGKHVSAWKMKTVKVK